jgi:hypothetical protein
MEQRRPVRVDAARLAETLAAMALATLGTDAGPLAGVTADSVAWAFADRPDTATAVQRIIEWKVGKL